MPYLSNSIAHWLGMTPADLFLYMFLPPLLLDSAVRTDYFIFKKVRRDQGPEHDEPRPLPQLIFHAVPSAPTNSLERTAPDLHVVTIARGCVANGARAHVFHLLTNSPALSLLP